MSALAAPGAFCITHDDACRKNGDLLQIGRQWSNQIDPGDGFQLTYLLKAKLGFASCDHRTDRFGRDHAAFAGDLIGNTQTLEQLAGNIYAASAVGISDRLGCQERAPERVNRADVRSAPVQRNADARAGKVHAAVRYHLAFLDQIV